MKIKCTKCGRVLGDTDKSLDANINCRGCRQAVNVKVLIAKTADYLPVKEEKK